MKESTAKLVLRAKVGGGHRLQLAVGQRPGGAYCSGKKKK